MKLIEITGDSTGIVEMAGVRREVDLSLLENPRVGDYLIIHTGFAIQVMDENEARTTLSLLREIAEADHA
jgi:hydrogenase expression/formation protein HypC